MIIIAKKGRKLTIEGYAKKEKYSQDTLYVDECEPGHFTKTDFPNGSECTVHKLVWTGPKGYRRVNTKER